MAKQQYLEIGQAVGTHGVRGELRVNPWCDAPSQWAVLRRVFTAADGTGERKCRARAHGNVVLLTLDGVATVEQAAALRGTVFYAAREDWPLPEGRYFICDLLGMQVVDEQSGEVYGTVCDVSHTGANDVYHIGYQGREVLIPAIPSVIKKVDLDADRITVHPMAGLFDDED